MPPPAVSGEVSTTPSGGSPLRMEPECESTTSTTATISTGGVPAQNSVSSPVPKITNLTGGMSTEDRALTTDQRECAMKRLTLTTPNPTTLSEDLAVTVLSQSPLPNPGIKQEDVRSQSPLPQKSILPTIPTQKILDMSGQESPSGVPLVKVANCRSLSAEDIQRYLDDPSLEICTQMVDRFMELDVQYHLGEGASHFDPLHGGSQAITKGTETEWHRHDTRGEQVLFLSTLKHYCTIIVRGSGPVEAWDTCESENPCAELIQLCQILLSESVKERGLRLMTGAVAPQSGIIDCGALACFAHHLSGCDLTLGQVKYNQANIRHHFLMCLLNGVVTKFPYRPKRLALEPTNLYIYPIPQGPPEHTTCWRTSGKGGGPAEGSEDTPIELGPGPTPPQ